MSLALSLLNTDTIGVSAAQVSGSIWNGRLTAAQFRNIPLGDVELSLKALALLAGTGRLVIKSDLGRATLVRGEMHGFEAADAAIKIETLRLGAPLSGRLRLENTTLLFSNGRCARAEGRVSTDALALAFDGPEISGRLTCVTDSGVARLEGQTPETEVSVTLRLDAGGRFQAETHVASSNPLVRSALALAGFAEHDNRFLRIDEGVFGS